MYVNSLEVDVDTRCTIQQYLRLIQKRASGKQMITSLASQTAICGGYKPFSMKEKIAVIVVAKFKLAKLNTHIYYNFIV